MSLENRIPPVIVVAVLAGAMWALRAAVPGLTVAGAGRLAFSSGVRALEVLALVLLVLGILVAGAGVREFRRASTTVDPLNPDKASAIVETGVFRFTRNPMYLGMLLLLAALAAWLANPAAAAGPVAFVLYMNRFQIRPEERALERRFGDPYRAYLGRVRRWI